LCRLFSQVSLLIPAALAAAAVGLGVDVAARSLLNDAVAALHQYPVEIGLNETLALVLLALLPVAAFALTYFAGWQFVRLVHVFRYLRALHAYAVAYVQRHAPLTRLGYSATGLPFTPDGTPVDGALPRLAAMLPGTHGTFLLGDDGMGKTIALWEYAARLTRKRHILAVAIGRAPLPVPALLAAYASAPPEPGRPRLRYLAAQIRAFGHERVAARLPVALGRWNAVVLCDGLDEVPTDARAVVVSELAELASDAYPRVRLVVTCALNAYLDEPEFAVSLKTLQRVVLTGLGAESLADVLRQAQRSMRRGGGSGSGSGERLEQLLASTRARSLGAQVGHPATLAALLELRAAGVMVPAGRARLLGEYANLLCARASGDGQRTEADQLTAVGRPALAPGHSGGTDVRDVMGWVANTLRTQDAVYVPVEPGESAGEALRRWCTRHQPLAPATAWEANGDRHAGASQSAPRFSFSGTALERAALASIAAGILEWHPDGLGLRFAQTDLAAVFTAISLADADIGAGIASPHEGAGVLPAALLLQPWRAPMVLWSGICPDPGELAARVLRTGERLASEPVGPWDTAQAEDLPEVESATVALALAILLEGVVPALERDALAVADQRQRLTLIGAHVQDLFDRVQAMTVDSRGRQDFVEAVIAVERESGCDLSADIVTLARTPSLGRLVRAQAVGLLGVLGTSSAVDGLMALLTEADPMLRTAVDTALSSSGPAALGRLQDALRSPDELVRARAAEALSLGGPEAVEAAMEGLEGTDPLERAAAARVLGTLNAEVARDALLARVEDSDSGVRVAAAWALGRVGTGRLVPTITAHLSAADAELRAALALALGAIRHGHAMPALTQLLNDPDSKVRAAAAEALGQLGDKRAASSLRTHLTDGDPWAQAAAATALRRLETH
jgi:HEAT repeat protein